MNKSSHLFCILASALVVSCSNVDTVHTAQIGQSIKYECVPDKIEVGLKFTRPIIDEYTDDKLLIDVEVNSEVRIIDNKSGDVVEVSRSNTPVVLWKFPKDSRHIEYLGLQEVEISSEQGCSNYSLELTYNEASLASIDPRGAGYVWYARRARRP